MLLSAIIVIAAVGLLTGLSVAADRKLRGVARVPMQWGVDGHPTWSAPRAAALAFTPALGCLVLTTLAVWDTGQGFPTVLAADAAVFLLVHGFYVRTVVRRMTERG